MQKLLVSSDSPPIRKDMADLLQHVSELDASQAEHSLSSVLLGLHMTRHASLLERLLQHSVVGKGQAQSVYTGRPYVIPGARRILQHNKSPYHQVGMVTGDTLDRSCQWQKVRAKG